MQNDSDALTFAVVGGGVVTFVTAVVVFPLAEYSC